MPGGVWFIPGVKISNERHLQTAYYGTLLFQHSIVRSNNDVAMCEQLCALYLIGTQRLGGRGACVGVCVVAVSTGPTTNFFAT